MIWESLDMPSVNLRQVIQVPHQIAGIGKRQIVTEEAWSSNFLVIFEPRYNSSHSKVPGFGLFCHYFCCCMHCQKYINLFLLVRGSLKIRNILHQAPSGIVWLTLCSLVKIGLSIDPAVLVLLNWKLTVDWQSNFNQRAKFLGMFDVYSL